MSATNTTRRTSLGKRLLTINRHFRKTLQYLNSGGIPDDSALWISPCHGIFTIGMKSPVDIAFLDRDSRVVRVLKNFPPDCFAESSPDAVSALEMPADSLSRSRTAVGDIIELKLD